MSIQAGVVVLERFNFVFWVAAAFRTTLKLTNVARRRAWSDGNRWIVASCRFCDEPLSLMTI